MKRSLTSRLSQGMEAPFNLTHVETDSISTVSQTQWESRKEVTRALYLTQKLPLKQIKVIMARTYSFCATERMYQRQISNMSQAAPTRRQTMSYD
ncbi:hypothetical protein CFRS1_v015749 [Colletotrichum fructicola]|nr:hypothetical protein CFRS1_v015749 [Colletotrichum fructicola]